MMDETTQYGKLHKLFDDNFMDYTSYVIKERAIPDLTDGLKPVQRRIMQTLRNMDDGRFNKVANVVGDCMKLHPHGDASIFAALVNLANKGFLIDRQGNFGNIYTGDQASAARYIECRLSPLAKEILFNKDLTSFVDSYDGRMLEPVALPAKVPLLLMMGAEGIAVGMATKIMPHNFTELLEAQKKILRDEEFEIYPDFPKGGLLDISGYDKGNGRLKCRARVEEKDEKTIHITEIPHSTTTESLIESVERAARTDKLKIMSINDYTAEDVEIEIKLPRGVYAADTIRALYAFTDCEVSISPNLTVICDNSPATMSVDEVLRYNTDKLVGDLEKELNIELSRLKEKLHAHLLEQIFIEERLYKQIEECKSYKEVLVTIDTALEPFKEKLVREVTQEDIEKLLEIRIKRISRYDINKKSKEIKDVRAAIKKVEKFLKDVVGYTIDYIDSLLKKYGDSYPRRTELKSFREVEVRKVALSNLNVEYDRENGFLGHQVKGNAESSIACSEYDRLMIIFESGMYKFISVPDKIFIGHDIAWIGKAEDHVLFNMIYRDGAQNLSYVKKFDMPKFILEKEYQLFPEHKKSKIFYLKTGKEICLRVHLAPSKRARQNYVDIALGHFLTKGAGAKGKRVSSRVVRRVNEINCKTLERAEEEPGPQPGLFDKKESA